MSRPTSSSSPSEPVQLRPIVPEDLEGIFSWYNDPEIVAPFDRFVLDGFEGFRRAIAEAADDPRSLAPRLAVVRPPSTAPIGIVGHYLTHPVLELTDIWYVLGSRSERGKGYGRSAVRQLVGRLFGGTPMPRVGATTDVANSPSVRLLEGLGFRREGVLRAALFHHQAWHDVAVYGLTREEWTKGARSAGGPEGPASPDARQAVRP